MDLYQIVDALLNLARELCSLGFPFNVFGAIILLVLVRLFLVR